MTPSAANCQQRHKNIKYIHAAMLLGTRRQWLNARKISPQSRYARYSVYINK